jgi:hypothetical protein
MSLSLTAACDATGAAVDSASCCDVEVAMDVLVDTDIVVGAIEAPPGDGEDSFALVTVAMTFSATKSQRLHTDSGKDIAAAFI